MGKLMHSSAQAIESDLLWSIETNSNINAEMEPIRK